MIQLNHMLPIFHEIRDIAKHTIFFWSLNYPLVFLQTSGPFYAEEATRSKEELEAVFRNSLIKKPLIVIIKLVNQYQQCINVQGSYFDKLKYCLT